MNEKQKVLRLIEAMQQKEKDGSLLWCVAEDLKTMAGSLTDDDRAGTDNQHLFDSRIFRHLNGPLSRG